MLGKVRKMLGTYRAVLREQRALRDITRIACPVSELRQICGRDVRDILENPEAHAAWAAAEQKLADICHIEDGTTGGVNPGDRRAVWYLVHGLGARSVLEVGTHVGASTVHIAAALRHHPPGHAGLVTVDIRDVNDDPEAYWQAYGLGASPRMMLEQLGCDDLVTFVAEPSLTHLDRCENAYDFIFLDGDHAAATVYQEIPRALKALREGGVILLHDYFPGNRPLWSTGPVVPGPFIAVSRLKAEGAALDVLPLGDLPWTTKGTSKRTSLALLTRSD